ncbi:MAG: SIR2 family protein [Proteobacteria bacterium]|nr:SIR2 family protein [Pseudomonadota bacterium]
MTQRSAGTKQILKTRDDKNPVYFVRVSDEPGKDFKLAEGATCSWAKTTGAFGTETLRPRIEPWLTALVQSENLSLLVGSGLTHAAHGIARSKPGPGMDAILFKTLNDQIIAEANRAAIAARRNSGNIEDTIRAANEILRGAEIIALTKKEGTKWRKIVSELQNDLNNVLSQFAKSILKGEQELISADALKREESFNYLVSFLMSFASRSGTRERLHIFTTNYDRTIEASADIAGLRLMDRFVGTLSPIFRSSRLDVDFHYNPPGIRGEPRYLEGVARFTKLHGSIDWFDCKHSIRRLGIPFGAKSTEPYLADAGVEGTDALRLMIYPNAAKDRETASQPYVDLFRDLAAAICRPNSTIICYGYAFGDEHINRVLKDMLTIPSTHLVVISRDDPLGRIMSTYDELGRPAQITLLIGDHLGDMKTLVDHYLPKSAIDRTTFRMAELLKARWTTGEGRETLDSAGVDAKEKGGGTS